MCQKEGSTMARRRRCTEIGAGMVEYAVLIAVLVLAVVLALNYLGDTLGKNFSDTGTTLAIGESDRPVSFADKFDDLDDWHKVQGKWKIERGKLQGGKGESRIFSNAGGKDYVVTIDSVELKKGKGYGIYFRATDVKKVNGYTFQFDPGYGMGAFLFRKWTKGRERGPFARQWAPKFDWNKEHRIRLEIKGNTFTAFVNGKEVLTGSDDTYSEGVVGLRTWSNSKVSFDNLSVASLD